MSGNMNLWIATGNKGKISEFKVLLNRELPALQIFTTSDLPTYTSPLENGQSFLENARIKARSLKAMKPEAWVMAEDSGLEVLALNQLPGIHSARYAGPKAQDRENIAKLLKMMQIRAVANRLAQFVCTMVLLTPENQEFVFTGEMKGEIAKNPTGQLGFGYDPVFIPEGEKQSLAELGPGFKSKRSHRASATLQMIEKLKTQI